LLLHHSHTDIGYTHSQPVVLELHKRFIELALDAADATRDWPDESKFKWTCEVTGVTVPWWQQASSSDRRRFLSAVDRGQFEAAALKWNITPLVDDRMLLKHLEPIHFLRQQGVPVTSAMNSDVNGAPWGLVDALLDFGIDTFSMGVNEHYGYAPQPRPRGFWWESPTNRKILVWNGLQYWNAANIQMRIPESIDAVAKAMPAFLRIWEGRGYPYSFLPVQITTASAPDNASPDPGLPQFVKDWNAASPEVSLRMVTLSQMFDRLKCEEALQTFIGDWTDWWNFGSGSTARETSFALEGGRLLNVSEQLSCWPGISFARHAQQNEQAENDIMLYTEHTWGSDRSVSIPESPETAAQLSIKTGYAYSGFLQARMLRRDGLERVALYAGGDDLTALIYNPLPHPVRRTVRLPIADGEFQYLSEPKPHHHHRQDVVFGDQALSKEAADRFQWVGPIDLPALGFVTLPLGTASKNSGGLSAAKYSLDNDHVQIQFCKGRAGIESLIVDGTEYAAPNSEFNLCEPVLEKPRGGTRGEIFGPLDWRATDVHEQWRPDWVADRKQSTEISEPAYSADDASASYEQYAALPTGDRITLTYRLFAESRSVDFTVTIIKAPDTDPHGIYIAMPLSGSANNAACHYETAGAIVRLDKEQIPFSSKHYITVQNFIRLQDENQGMTVVCPDAPLWQIGGFTFGRHLNGEVERSSFTLNAWLTNNYWDVNFSARQSGAMQFRFHLIPHKAELLEASIVRASTYFTEPQIHVYKLRGPVKHTDGVLLAIEPGAVLLTETAPEYDGLTLTLLNPTDDASPFTVGSGAIVFKKASIRDLAGNEIQPLDVVNGEVHSSVPPRKWFKIHLSDVTSGKA
jgi:alpha-mannosidase